MSGNGTLQKDRSLLYCCVCHGMLQRPVLWSCLHGCCRKCSESQFAAAQATAGQVVCPVCETVVEAAYVTDNALIAAHIDGLQSTAAGRMTCDTCRDEEVDSIACYSCADCCRSLCDKCRTWHDKFKKDHVLVPVVGLDEQQSLQLPSRPSMLGLARGSLCLEHHSPHEFFCFDCARLKCSACVKECMEARHDSSGVTSERVGAHVASLSESLRAELARLEQQLQTMAGVAEQAAAARTVEVMVDERLGTSHQLALEAVSGTFELAQKDLNDAYDSLAETVVPDVAARAAPLAARLTHALKYCSALLDSTAAGARGGSSVAAADDLLDQRKVVLACIDSLAEEASRLPTVPDESELTLIECKQDGRLRNAVFRYMGGSGPGESDRLTGGGLQASAETSSSGGSGQSVPFLSSTAASDSVAAAPPSMEHSLSSSTSAPSSTWATGTDIRQHDEGPRGMVAGSLGPLTILDVQDIADSFRAVATCHDIAFTTDGHILLAALENGLKQYEASSGRKRRTWYPSGSGRLRVVSTVDALADGRAAVGLIGACCVVVLRRTPPDGWLEERCIKMEMPPYRLALLGDRFAVASANARETGKSCGWTPGPHLCVGTVLASDGGSPLVSRKLGYDILAIALITDEATTAMVVVSSHEKQLTNSGMQRFVIEAYGDGGRGSCLWQYASSEDVFDLCTVASSCVIYMALPKSKRVAAINGKDGSWLADVLTTSRHTLVAPNRLAVLLTAEHGTLAVLSGNGMVALYPIA